MTLDKNKRRMTTTASLTQWQSLGAKATPKTKQLWLYFQINKMKNNNNVTTEYDLAIALTKITESNSNWIQFCMANANDLTPLTHDASNLKAKWLNSVAFCGTDVPNLIRVAENNTMACIFGTKQRTKTNSAMSSMSKRIEPEWHGYLNQKLEVSKDLNSPAELWNITINPWVSHNNTNTQPNQLIWEIVPLANNLEDKCCVSVELRTDSIR